MGTPPAIVRLDSPRAPATEAKTLPLPVGLIGLDTPAGRRLLLRSGAQGVFFALSHQYVAQMSQRYCGVATLVMVLNALGIPAPGMPGFAPFRKFTQEDFFTAPVRAVVTPESVSKRGMSLAEIAKVLATQPVEAKVRYAGDSSLEEFRAFVRQYLRQEQHFVIVNYLRRAIGQETGGHISPLAGFDEDTDRVLLLDVARNKYPPVWVKTADLFDAMNTVTPNPGRPRSGSTVDRLLRTMKAALTRVVPTPDRTRGYILVAAARNRSGF